MKILLVVTAGWGMQVVTWSASLWRVRAAAAARHEWPRELVLRALVLGLAAGSLIVQRGALITIGPSAGAALLAAILAGHGLAAYGRVHLGRAWGIGTAPRGRTIVHSGPYRLLAHPIYVGTGTAILAQALLLQNWPALLLLFGAAAVNPWKIMVENRSMREAQR